MSYNLELSYKMAILSAVTYDQSHPQHCLDQYLPSAKFQLQTVFTKNCDFVDRKCSGYIAVSHALRALVVAFRGTECTRQLIDELLESVTTPSQDFLNGKVHAYFKTAFEDLWQCMKPKVKALVSKNPSYQIWVTGHSLGAALASLASAWLAYYNIAARQNVILPPLILPTVKSGRYHHCVEVFYSEKAISVQSAHRECYGTPRDEDKTCSRSKRPFLNLPESVTRHKNYFNIAFVTFCKESSSLREKAFQFRKESCTSCN